MNNRMNLKAGKRILWGGIGRMAGREGEREGGRERGKTSPIHLACIEARVVTKEDVLPSLPPSQRLVLHAALPVWIENLVTESCFPLSLPPSLRTC